MLFSRDFWRKSGIYKLSCYLIKSNQMFGTGRWQGLKCLWVSLGVNLELLLLTVQREPHPAPDWKNMDRQKMPRPVTAFCLQHQHQNVLKLW